VYKRQQKCRPWPIKTRAERSPIFQLLNQILKRKIEIHNLQDKITTVLENQLSWRSLCQQRICSLDPIHRLGNLTMILYQSSYTSEINLKEEAQNKTFWNDLERLIKDLKDVHMWNCIIKALNNEEKRR